MRMRRSFFSMHCFQVCAAIIITMMSSMLRTTAHFYMVCIPGESTVDENLFQDHFEFCADQEEAIIALMESCGSHAVGFDMAIVDEEEETSEKATSDHGEVLEIADEVGSDIEVEVGGMDEQPPGGRTLKRRDTNREDACENLARPPTDGQRMACCIMGSYSFCGQFENSSGKQRDLVEDNEGEEDDGEGHDADEVVHARMAEIEAECTLSMQEYARTTKCFGNPEETKCLGFFVST